MSREWERVRDESMSGRHELFNGWDSGPDDGPAAAARVDAMTLRWHQKHVDHEPLCHLCREIARLKTAYDTQAEYVRPEAAD